ncbi:MAG: hypothetical protein GY868_19660 [Deltaproteobacteria bacterium]|nr:hypothetical protein [Deltaproteobacteria bacterium]
MMIRTTALLLTCLIMAFLTTGCLYNRYLTNSKRSATEQLLLTETMHAAVEQLTIPDVNGLKTAVEVVSLAPDEEPYLRCLVEEKLRRAGALIAPAEGASAVYLVQVGTIGTISRETTVGIPSVPLGPGLATPALPFVRILKQHGYTKLRLSSYDRVTGKHLTAGEPVITQKNFDVFGFFFLAVRHNQIYPGTQIQLTID